MTSRSPRKPRTTAPGTRAATPASLAGLLLLAAPAAAQPGRPAAAPARPGAALVYQKPAAEAQPPAQPGPGLIPEKGGPDPKGPPPSADTPGFRDLPPQKLPSPAQIFTARDDAGLRRTIIRLVAEDLKLNPADMIPFPDYDQKDPVVPPGTKYVAKTASYPPVTAYTEPGFVVHRRLHFEEKNSERYGWDLGIIQPFVSTAAFYKDCLLWPNSLASGLEVGFWDTSAGKCLPGTPVAYYLYPPGLTLTGVGATLGVYTAGSFILNPVGAGNALLNGPILR